LGGIGVQVPSTFHNPSSEPSPTGPGGGLGYPGPTATNVSGGTPGKFWFAGGGGGGTQVNGSSVGNVGAGGGPGGPYAGAGPSGYSPPLLGGVSALQNSGSGGGGGLVSPTIPASASSGGNGGSGIVLIAYPS
jgi:hypothetical protein